MSEQRKRETVAKCLCSGCNKYFFGVSYHEQHRVAGKTRSSRRCLSTEEMVAQGMASERKTVRLVVDGKPAYEEQDVWYSIKDRERVQHAAFQE
jgi:hypothetical protein